MDQDMMKKAEEIIAKNSVQGGSYQGQICVITVIDSEGFPFSSVATPSKADGIKQLTFAIQLDGDKAKCIAKCNRASVCFGTTEYSISLMGEVEIVTDAAVKKEMWYDSCSNFFDGPEDPNYGVLVFTTKRHKFFL